MKDPNKLIEEMYTQTELPKGLSFTPISENIPIMPEELVEGAPSTAPETRATNYKQSVK